MYWFAGVEEPMSSPAEYTWATEEKYRSWR